MRSLAAILLPFALAAGAQVTSSHEAPKQLLQNPHVTVSLVDIPAGGPILPKRDHDTLTVIVRGGAKATAPGRVYFRPAGHAETATKTQAGVRAVTVEFSSSQGAEEKKHPAPSRYCNPGSKTACVSEKYLLCTPKMCVEEATMGAGAVTTRHSHDTDHMIIAISDYSLSDDVAGKGVVMRNVKSGGVEYIPAGITHTLTNKSGGDIRFVVVAFR